MRPADAASAPLSSAGQPPVRSLEIWVGADADADNLLVLRPDGDGYALADPQNGWRDIRRFAAYEAAYRWLTGEAYERANGR